MSNVKYLLKTYYWEELTFSKVRFSKFEKFVSRSVFGEVKLMQISLNFKFSCWKLKRNRKWKIPHIFFKRRTLCCNSKLKVKLWLAGAWEWKKRAFFVPFIFSEETFLSICGLSQYIVYWINYQNIHTFKYQIT